jgi:hypothetical protein
VIRQIGFSMVKPGSTGASVVTENFVGLVIVKLRISVISLVRVFCSLMMRSTGIWPDMVTAGECEEVCLCGLRSVHYSEPEATLLRATAGQIGESLCSNRDRQRQYPKKLKASEPKPGPRSDPGIPRNHDTSSFVLRPVYADFCVDGAVQHLIGSREDLILLNETQ